MQGKLIRMLPIRRACLILEANVISTHSESFAAMRKCTTFGCFLQNFRWLLARYSRRQGLGFHVHSMFSALGVELYQFLPNVSLSASAQCSAMMLTKFAP